MLLIKKWISAIVIALCCVPAIADSSNGDMSDRGGETFEQLSNQSWGRYDSSDVAVFEHWFGPNWRCPVFAQGCKPINPGPPSPIPEPTSWLLALFGITTILVWRKLK